MSKTVGLTVDVDVAHGGRWTSLRGGGREWFWARHAPDRDAVSPGDAFVDAGGLEECIPTVRGTPDHGDAWSRRWVGNRDLAAVECPDFTMTRRIGTCAGAIVAEYHLAAAPGYRFIWAAHALLALSDLALLDAPEGLPTRLFPEGAPHLDGTWPAPARVRLDRLGPCDSSAIGAVLRFPSDCAVRVVDGPDALRMRLDADDQPTSVALWRNLGGYPSTNPYRSIGVEPMLGATFDLSSAGVDEAAIVPPSGELTWQLTLTAERR